MHGESKSSSGTFKGVRGWFKKLERKSYKMHVRVLLSRYRGQTICPDCDGTRFRPDALLYRLDGRTIAEIYAATAKDALEMFRELDVSEARREIVDPVKGEIVSRLHYLVEVGLDYLSLDRQSRTLSGGETQRVNLTTALGSSLVNTLYVLDEPSIGLHARDGDRLLQVLRGLRDQGNTVVVVEHDPAAIRAADLVIDIGPQAGRDGGHLLHAGTLDGLLEHSDSLTGAYLTGRRKVPAPGKRRKPVAGREILVENATENNLKGVDVAFPLGLFVCVSGVSGSGKSTLVHDVLYKGLQRSRGEAVESMGACEAIHGTESVGKVILVDASPAGSTSRSNPATYVGAWDGIRELLADSSVARERGYSPRTFSFNVAGGRCETCQGEGFERVEMQFLSDVHLPCPDCEGKRFVERVLEVTTHGKSVDEILALTVAEAIDVFADRKDIVRALKPLVEVGLGYLRLGQPIPTLSGGEAQRLKLAAHLREATRESEAGPVLFLLDEPTTGLHLDDVAVLVRAIDKLVDAGHSVIVIEHHLDVIRAADWVIDLGPEGGDAGGDVVAAGTPEKVSRSKKSQTAPYLREALAEAEAEPKPKSKTKKRRAVAATGESVVRETAEVPAPAWPRRSRSAERASTISATSTSRSPATSSWSSPAPVDPASPRSRSTSCSPRDSDAISNRSRPTRVSSSRRCAVRISIH